MNDRFKFKGYWYNDVLKEWRVYDEPEFITGDGTAEIWYDTEGGAEPELPPNADLHLCQSTGLKDKNGKLIYEGDILQQPQLPHKVVCEWYKDGFWLNGFMNGAKRELRNMHNWYEVIGNIYENKELLESEA